MLNFVLWHLYDLCHSYAVGSVYDSEECEQCICGLNGISQCAQKTCPSCEQVSNPRLQTSAVLNIDFISKMFTLNLLPCSDVYWSEKLEISGI